MIPAAKLALSRLEPEPERSGLVLCDPFCGRGSLLIEATRIEGCAAVLAGDAALPSDAALRSELQANLGAAVSAQDLPLLAIV